MRGVEKLVFIYELGNLVKSKYIILFPVLYLGLFLGFIGIFGAHEPFSFWFPLLLLLLSAFLASLFVNTLGIAIGLATARFNSPSIINALPSIPLILYMISLLLPEKLQQYNPLTATFVMMGSSLTTEVIPRDQIFLSALVIVSTVLVLMMVNTLLARKLRDINLYDLFK